MIMICYKSDKSIMTMACYEGGKLIMTNLIIIKIKFVCFEENEVGRSRVRLYAKSRAKLRAKLRARLYNHKSCDHSVTQRQTAKADGKIVL